ncbi:MAG: phage integrase N-terminal SAM-like domain-containing protein [Pseudomonadota bacterium]
MNTASVGTPSQKMSVGKPELSLVRDAKPKLLDQLREALRARHYSRRTEQTYCSWVKRFIHFDNVRHPAEMAEAEINAFLTHLAVKERVSASTQNQALSALLFFIVTLSDAKSATWARSSAPASPSVCPS